ncbi:deoxyribonuclease-4 [Methanohalophilus levihalophilus]|uniref:TIM barrel protein n=1 Tax=Methanohalophilus levihalophilus TaxID=1431282 RepID=UPI001AE5A8E6|nr:deoxyribonuclease IV [Methanohalophilus levihalophilus]MBP2030109.1 deoxyribonuclease-4 [Methanohalophilus levihalophilus]
MPLLFGTAGTPISAKGKGSAGGIRRIRELGLGCMELEFVRGVRMKEDTAKEIAAVATENDVALSVHAPYYINFNSREPEKIEASIKRIYDSARIGSLCGASSIVFHPAYYHGEDSETVFEKVMESLDKLRKTFEEKGINVILRPETTGKGSQFGSLEETLKMSAEMEGVMPCIDFAHLHARANGEVNTYEEFANCLSLVEEYLGKEGLKDMHIHISGIEYTPKGEKNHLVLKESDLNYHDLMKALKDFSAEGLVICESPNLEADALLLQETFEKQ